MDTANSSSELKLRQPLSTVERFRVTVHRSTLASTTLETSQSLFGDEHPQTLEILDFLVTLYDRMGDDDMAKVLSHRLVDLARKC